MNKKTLNRIMKSRLHLLPVAATTLILAGALSANATLIAYDGFTGADSTPVATTANQINGGNGGVGWLQRTVVPPQWGGNSAWSADSRAIVTNKAVSLSYNAGEAWNGALETTGNRAVVGYDGTRYPTTGGQSANLQRLMPGNMFAMGGTVWVSFLYQNLNTDMGLGGSGTAALGWREANIKFFGNATTNTQGNAQINGTETLSVGSPNTWDTRYGNYIGAWSGASTAMSTLTVPRGSSEAAVFCVLRFDVDSSTATATDTVHVWFNPTLAATPQDSDGGAITGIDFTRINALRLNAGNVNNSATNALFAVDEIRLGTTFADVAPIPEPAAFGLATLGGLALLSLRRKRS